MNDFTFTAKGFEDYLYWQVQDKKTLKRINGLLEDIKRNGAMKGIGKPEPLRYRTGYSRRIDECNNKIEIIREKLALLVNTVSLDTMAQQEGWIWQPGD